MLHRTALCLRRKLQSLHEPPDALQDILSDAPEPLADIGRAHHADGYCLTVMIAHISGFLLDGVRHRMPEIQDAPKSAFLFVLAHNLRLDLTGTGNDMGQDLRIQCQYFRGMLFQKRKKIRIIDDAVFHDLPESRIDLTLWQRFHPIEIHEDRLWLIKSADEVFPQRMIDRHLASDAGIHLRQKACRKLDERHAPHVGGCHEPCQISHHAAAKGKDSGMPVKSLLDAGGNDLFHLPQALRFLARRNQAKLRLQPRFGKQCLGFLPVQAADIRIRYNQRLAGKSGMCNKAAKFTVQPESNENVIAVPAKLHPDLTHA